MGGKEFGGQEPTNRVMEERPERLEGQCAKIGEPQPRTKDILDQRRPKKQIKTSKRKGTDATWGEDGTGGVVHGVGGQVGGG